MKRALLFMLSLALGGCSGGDNRGAAEPLTAIDGFDAAPEAGSWPRSRLNTAVLAEPGASREAALDRLNSEDPDIRIAAVYALSITLKPEDADVLAPVLGSAIPGERVLAAAGMLAVGDGRAIPVLIEALGVEDGLPFGSPRLRTWEQARFSLLSLTGQDFGLREATTAQEAAATAPQWESWWATAEMSFKIVRAPGRFDP